jgi:hypothetical protein
MAKGNYTKSLSYLQPGIRQKRWTTGGRWAGRPAAGRRRPWVVVEVGGVIVSGLPGFEAVV